MSKISYFTSVLLAGVALTFLRFGHLEAKASTQAFSPREKALISHVTTSIEKAEKGISKLDEHVLHIEGMSSPIIRRFLNNLCALKSARYLEIGCWKGSTLIAATYKNEATLADVVAIDNWSESNGPKNEFLWNVNSYIHTAALRFYEVNSFSIDKDRIFHQPVNIYFYDGDHSFAAQKAAFTFYDSVLDDVFITCVDDWNWESVRNGTFAAFNELGYEVLYERTFYTPANQDTNSWWNGFYIAVIKKTKGYFKH
jgi:hypothetical protein